MCSYCDSNSPNNRIYADSLTGEYYLDIEIPVWDDYEDDWMHHKEYIRLCPWCGRKLRKIKYER